MTVYVISGLAYHRRMSDDGLPRPAAFLSVAEIAEQLDHVRAVLAHGGAVVVVGDDRAEVIGVLTRQQPLLDEAEIAAMIDAGHLPEIRDLLAMDDRGELP